jgi:hypothetical protein
MNDDEMLATMRSSLTSCTDSMTDVRLERPVSTIQARARGRRVRRGLAGASAGGLALGIGLALAAGVGSPGGGSAGGGSAAPRARPVHVNLDAWSVNTLPSGLVYVDVRELQNPGLLRQTLADAGIPAIVTFGEICTGPNGGGTDNLQQIIGKTAADGEARLTLNPAGIPQGSELSIGIVPASKTGARGFTSGFSVVKKDAKLTCGQPGTNPAGKGKTGPVSPAGSGTVKTGVGK